MLEVLFSIFILSVGLLGLLALIPVGTVDVAEATKADRGAVTGRAAYREVKIRKMLFPGMWMDHILANDPNVPGNVPDYATAPPPQLWIDLDDLTAVPPPDSPVNEGHSVCIDPLFIARSHAAFVNSGAGATLPAEWPGRAFPYFLDNDPYDGAGNHPTSNALPVLGPPRMSRVSLRSWPSVYAPMMSLGLADRVFRWEDDVLFELPSDETLRPLAVTDVFRRGQSDGNYSWLVTLTPADGTADVVAGQRRVYTYTVVVFYQRNLDPPVLNQAALSSDGFSWNLADRGVRPSERVVFADFPAAGVSFGGGDVRLRLVVQPPADALNGDASLPDKNDFTNIRSNNWILLSGYLDNGGHHQSVFQWYRILAADDGPRLLDPDNGDTTVSNEKEWVRDVTLAGPDWNPTAFVDADGVAPYWTCYATLVEGVVAVFSKTIELDTWSGL